jgi:hypothetical protein
MGPLEIITARSDETLMTLMTRTSPQRGRPKKAAPDPAALGYRPSRIGREVCGAHGFVHTGFYLI